TPLRGVSADDARTLRARELLLHARRNKDAREVALLRRTAVATAAGFEKLRAALRPGVTERALQIELEAEFFRHGGTRAGYGSIVGRGPTPARLYSTPSGRAPQPGDFLLVDAGAEIDRYTSDVT